MRRNNTKCDGSYSDRMAEPNGKDVYCICCGKYFSVSCLERYVSSKGTWYRIPDHNTERFIFRFMRRRGIAGAFSS